MLKAFELMHEMGERGLQFILVGHEGWGLQEVRRAREASPVRSAIRYVGYIPDDALAVLYRSAELFLYLSLYEGFGLPPLEAMAAGTCVVASDRGSLPECLGDGAVLVDPFGIEGVAEIAVGLLRDRDLRIEWGRKGRQRAATFSWQRCAEETLSVYKSVYKEFS
jgi:glycosyltransferase involved in cell wall biosynthesis